VTSHEHELEEARGKKMKNMISILATNPIVPLVTVHDDRVGVDIATALLEGGISVIEVAFRSEFAVGAIEAIRAEVPEMTVGAGTIVSAEGVERARKAGSHFLVSPGSTPTLLAAMSDSKLPFLPGVSTPGEVILGIEHGLEVLKLFPAETMGGLHQLKALEGPFAEMKFCPTGGVSASNMKDYLSRQSVVAVGGSWLTPKDVIVGKQWSEISRLASEALSMCAQVNVE
jgi:2-dehydro-3-deoxyphosphogluconate aldolase / (4S)-4-hydroxy-2-oxoglutarate aldolase